MASQPNIIETISVDQGASWVESRRELAVEARPLQPLTLAALAGILLFLIPVMGIVLYLGLLALICVSAAKNARGRLAANTPRGHFTSQWLTVHDVQRADPTGTHAFPQWHFYTDQGIKLVAEQAYYAWLAAGHPTRIVLASWQDDPQGSTLRTAAPLAPGAKAGKKRSAKAKQPVAAAPGDDERLPSADIQSSAASSSRADVLQPAPDLKNVAVCAYCGTHNKLGAHRCEGCYKMLPWDVDAAKAAKQAAKQAASALPVSDQGVSTHAAPATTETQQAG